MPTFAKLQYSVGALTLRERPDLCAAIGKCVALWTYVDNEMGNIFSLLLGTESDATLEVFLSLRRASNQRQALEAAAKHSLSGVNMTAFRAIMNIYKSLEDERNALAHGCFGVSADDPSLLLWINVNHHVHFQTETLFKEAKGQFAADRHARLKENLYVYKETDLETLYDEMEKFWWAVFYFAGYLRDPKAPGRIAEFKKLCDFPRIKHEMERLEPQVPLG